MCLAALGRQDFGDFGLGLSDLKFKVLTIKVSGSGLERTSGCQGFRMFQR